MPIAEPEIILSEQDALQLAVDVLRAQGLCMAQSQALAGALVKAQRDGCLSHGLQRLPGTLDTMAHPKFNRDADPQPQALTPAVTRVDADYGFSILAAQRGLPLLVKGAKDLGIAMLAVSNGFHSTALWPLLEEVASHGLAAMSMNPTHDWVAPAGGTKGVLGTNPLAFAWPRPSGQPYVFDFATTAASRADIAMHRQSGQPIPEGWGLDPEGQPSTDAAAVLKGAMLPFGGHKGSALATMIELMSGPMIGDRTSRQSAEFDQGADAAPCHGEVIIAFNPALMGGDEQFQSAEEMFAAITQQGARLPGDRRYQARAETARNGLRVRALLHERILGLLPRKAGI